MIHSIKLLEILVVSSSGYALSINNGIASVSSPVALCNYSPTCHIDLDLVRGNLFFLRIDPNLLRSNFAYECMNLCRLTSYVEATAIADKHMVTNFFNVKFLFISSESFGSFEFAFSEWQKATQDLTTEGVFIHFYILCQARISLTPLSLTTFLKAAISSSPSLMPRPLYMK